MQHQLKRKSSVGTENFQKDKDEDIREGVVSKYFCHKRKTVLKDTSNDQAGRKKRKSANGVATKRESDIVAYFEDDATEAFGNRRHPTRIQ